ncbi:hypothetical protein NM688_g2326 [Phlebia brevispora]|uniref:Uncharacterized protein n=1 Tax=Phlebia brevispora TaxID=194682 RepID=A0ACC1T8P6_9APHY|nr:hypothetical protein NM688_g2326 [Phlebia brevispora]
MEIYEARLVTECLFPNSKLANTMIHEAWAQAAEDLKSDLEMTPLVYKMIARRATHLRSESKKVARIVVVQVYRFSTGFSDRAHNYNLALAARLKNDRGFTRPLDQLTLPVEQRKGLYRNSAIGLFMDITLFGKKNALGVSQSRFFGKVMPQATMAYALTMLEYGISEWETGSFVDKTFFEHEWTAPYFSHIADIKNFDEATAAQDVYNRIAKRLLDNGRAHAGLKPLGTADQCTGQITQQTFANELLAYQNGELQSDVEDDIVGDENNGEEAGAGAPGDT